MIVLDGRQYKTYRKEFKHQPTTPGSTARAVNFAVIRQTGGNLRATKNTIRLLCTLADWNALDTTFDKQTPPTNLLNYVDERGFNWNPSAGVDDSTHAYSTGVYLLAVTPEPFSERGWNSGNLFFVDIVLQINATQRANA